MRRVAKIFVLLLCTLAVSLAGSHGKKTDRRIAAPESSSDRWQIRRLSDANLHNATFTNAGEPGLRLLSAPGDSFILAEYTFDGGFGGPDPQGWISVDVSNPVDTFFHVEDFVGLSGGYSSLQGSQSLWCGVRPDTFLFGEWATLPGYGNLWIQQFQSVPFVSEGNVTVSFLTHYDSEPNYDYTYVQYLTSGGGLADGGHLRWSG